MAQGKFPTLVFVCLLGVVAGCSRTAPNAAADGATAVAAPTPQVVAGNACERKLITAQDAAVVLGTAVTATKTIPGDPQSCQFSTAGFSSVTISLRPGHGRAVLGTYTSGKMNDYEKSEPVSGIGDEAVRSLDINRIVARKDDLLCEITGSWLGPRNGRCRGAETRRAVQQDFRRVLMPCQQTAPPDVTLQERHPSDGRRT